MHLEDDLVFHGRRRRLRGTGRRAVLPAGQSCGPGAAAAALTLVRELEARDGVPRVVMGSVPFDPDRPAHLVVPERVVDDVAPSVPADVPGGGSGPGPADTGDDPGYRAGVAAALRAVDAGLVRKIVLARSVDLEADAPVDVPRLFDAFATQNPAAYVFRMPLADSSVLVGASPELLAAVDGGRLTSLPLAGTAVRHADPVADAAARAALAASTKDRHEHAVLVQALAEQLGPLTRDLHVPDDPVVVETPQLWHLGTPVTGMLRSGRSVLDVAYAVHPTPAVCGVPRRAAADLVHVLEPTDRGHYAGLVGWMDSSGDGEWAIALRCAHVDGRVARLHVGAGVVAGSDPAAEHAETRAKLAPALRALAAVADVRVRELAVSA